MDTRPNTILKDPFLAKQAQVEQNKNKLRAFLGTRTTEEAVERAAAIIADAIDRSGDGYPTLYLKKVDSGPAFDFTLKGGNRD